jgi:hypothetical protein
VGDYKTGAMFRQRCDGIDHRSFRARVERRRRFVEHQQRRFLQQRSGNSDPLSFAARQGIAPLSHDGLIAVRELSNKVVSPCRLRRGFNFGWTRRWLTVGDVLSHRHWQEKRFLQ